LEEIMVGRAGKDIFGICKQKTCSRITQNMRAYKPSIRGQNRQNLKKIKIKMTKRIY
jgi:hypothetical protein